MTRISLKIVGASGQGINSIGEIVAKGLKRAGYCVFGYREYPSLIKGGHASYQLDCSNDRVRSAETKVNAVMALNHHGLEHNLADVKESGVLIHLTPEWKFSPEDQKLLRSRKSTVIAIPLEEILKRLGAKPILGNVLLAAFLWAALGQDKDELKALVGERFAKKKNLLELNMKCIEEGFSYTDPAAGRVSVTLPSSDPVWKDHLLVTGSQAMGLGAMHAGVRLYAGYPMTPSSPLLSFIADLQNQTGMVLKQAEDEITAAQIVTGAMFMGARALTATSGGGFDLMSETLSLNGILENPTVFVLAQRPGPATGLPTWTAQGDLLMAIHTAHGEFARCVLAVSDSQDAFDLMPVAFNLAEEFQISVIVLTDKQVAEALYTQTPFDQTKVKVERGKLVTDPAALKELKGTDRYDPNVKDGISLRWLPGSNAATYCAQGDEHNADGTVDETAKNAKEQMEKRMRKLESLKQALPEPELWKIENGKGRITNESPLLDCLIVGWGSSKDTVLDALADEKFGGKRIGYLHFTYLWPLKTERLQALAKKAKKIILVEQNYQGQLGVLIRQECGLEINEKILKYDGRPFFVDELIELIRAKLSFPTID
ncbi:2-oxoacid:acceptor oxidoreductase subunit alpha [Candidatus Peregrinibacteria bacterium]|nr:2-oxoacid:acceptor oxidoreductase subunit alpha [Candidatus Peregrinibacteria bacterium]MBI3816775.1 2-oxoacid:acceptor oxidoreductase subunit alpha [Candidatus Peregrinibacteria bacterium]